MNCRDSRIKRLLPLYEAGLLNLQEAGEVETHLLSCPGCAEEMFAMQPVITAIRGMESPLDSFEEPGFLVRFVSLRWASVATAAALLVVVCTSAWLLLPGWLSTPPHPPAADLARSLQHLEQMGMDDYASLAPSDSRFVTALDLFRQNRALDALAAVTPALPPVGQSSPAVHLAARCHLALDQPEAARRLLAQHPVPPGNTRYRDFLWIRAVASLRRGRHDAAIADLEELARHPGINQEASADLLLKVR